MEPQAGVPGQGQGQGPQPPGGQGQGRYCPTPMAPPAASPTPTGIPQQQHHPPAALSPAAHHGYYGHQQQHQGYPNSAHQQNYYPGHQQGYTSYQGHGQPPSHYPSQPQQTPQHQQTHWGQHSHSYFQNSTTTANVNSNHHQSYQPDYVAQPHNPYQHFPQHPRVHNQSQGQTLQPPQQQQQSQGQPQHALMNLSRFVSQQSPSSSPSPGPHSPTTPVPMGSPGLWANNNATTTQRQQQYPQSQIPMMHPPGSAGGVHATATYPPPHHDNFDNTLRQSGPLPTNFNLPMHNHPSGIGINSRQSPATPVPINPIVSDPVQSYQKDSSTSSVIGSTLMTNGSSGGRSESNSPSSNASGNRVLTSPPPTPNPAGNGHLIPVRLQNMQSGARTKAGMRKLMQEQQISAPGAAGSGTEDGNPASDHDDVKGSEKTPKPKKGKKGAPQEGEGGNDLSTAAETPAKPKRGRKPKAATATATQDNPKNSTPTPAKRGRKPKVQTPTVTAEQNEEKVTKKQRGTKPEPSPVAVKKTPVRKGKNKDVSEADEPKPTPPEESPQITTDVEMSPVPATKKKGSSSPKRKAGAGPVSASKKKSSAGKSTPARGKKKIVDSEPEEEDSMEKEVSEVEELLTPSGRPLRKRAVKEQPKKENEEEEASPRSRTTARSKRGSRSYRETSASRSKSPKESPKSAKTVSPKKSPRTASSSPVKSSPKKKESPSPGRGRQLKDKSPRGSKKMETRSSKEREEAVSVSPSPKRVPRRSKTADSEVDSHSADVDVMSPPPQKKQSRKTSKEVTPTRIPSPRQAKERSATPASTTAAQDVPESESISEDVQSLQRKPRKYVKKGQTPKSKAPRVVVTKKKKAPVAPRKRKSQENTENDTAIVQDAETAEVVVKVEVVSPKKTKKGGRRASASPKRKKSKSGSVDDIIKTAEEMPSATSASITSYLSCNESFPLEDSSFGTADTSLTTDTSSLDKTSEANVGELQRSSATMELDSSREQSNVKPIPVPTSVDKRRRSKSPRQAVDTAGRTEEPKKDADPNNHDHLPEHSSETVEVGVKVKKPRKSSKDSKKESKKESGEATQSPKKPKEKKITKAEQKRLDLLRRREALEAEAALVLVNLQNSPLKTDQPIINAADVGARAEADTTPVGPVQKKPRKKKSLTPQDSAATAVRPTTPLNFTPPPASNLSPDIASPIPRATPKRKKSQDTATAKLPKAKKIKLEQEFPVTSTPIILSVPQVNGAQVNQPVSTPQKPKTVKVAKTVTLPSTSTGLSSSIADMEAVIANVSSGLTPVSEAVVTETKPKTKKKKSTPATTAEGSESLPVALDKKPKAPRKRKSIPNVNGEATSVGNDSSTLENSLNQNGETPVPPKPKRKRSLKPRPIGLIKRKSPIPTVFAKPTFINGPTVGTSTDKDKAKIVGPTLKVFEGRTEFYRGGEKEEMDAEPPTSKRVQPQFDDSVPWLCCFCNLGPHTQKLGDLFGPYHSDQEVGSGKSKTMKKTETWMHQDCALWAGGVVLIGTKLHGLDECLSHGKKDKCTTCGNKGATIGCLKRGCKQAVHFPCAIRKSWKLDPETFHSFCPAHIT